MRNDIPKEAFSIDGEFLDDILPGFKTIKTSGRETLSAEISTVSTNRRDGEIFKYSRFPARTIEVNFRLKGDSLSDMRARFNTLNSILTAKEHKFVFNDEDDKYYTGIPTIESDITDIYNGGVGTIKIYCADPYKRSNEWKKVTATATGTGWGEATINYSGSAKTYPVMEIEFPSTCGYVRASQYANAQLQSALMFGRDEVKIDDSIVLDQNFSNNRGKFVDDTSVDIGLRKTGSSKVDSIGLTASSYGTENATHGIPVVYTLPNAMEGDFNIKYTQRVHMAEGTSTLQCGGLGVFLIDTSGKCVFFALLNKNQTADSMGKVDYRKNGTIVKTDTDIDLSYDNSPYRNSVVEISRSGRIIYISMPHAKERRSFVYDSAVSIAKIGFYFCQYASNATLQMNYVTDVTIVDGVSSPSNAFIPSTTIIDVANADINYDGRQSPWLGDISNSWDEFFLTTGENYIELQWSEWVDEAPEITLQYQEAWI